MRRPDQPPHTNTVFLELYVILYDMLNDDDDELRDYAAPIASWVLSNSTVFPDKIVDLADIPARERLVEFLSNHYSNEQRLVHYAVKRLMNNVVVSGGTSFVPFETLFNEHRKESTILFEEERQNLFIDDVREIDTWTTVLMNVDRPVFDHNTATVSNLFIWAVQGLACLDTLLESGEQDGAVGWTAKQEVYSLGILLFSVASLLMTLGEDKDSSLSKRLEGLYTKGEPLALHPHWLSRIRSAIVSQTTDSNK